MTVLLEAAGLHKAYARTHALRGASLAVEDGEVVAITGPSGSGKSTLLLCLAGVLRPEAGRVSFAGERIDELSDDARARLRRDRFGVVLQFGQLVPELTATDNVALPLLLRGHDRRAAVRLARDWLSRLGAGAVAGSLPSELSGGQAQRVAVARALIGGPQVVFADEPTGSLDTVGGSEVLRTLVGEVRQTGAALVLVTHDNRVAAHADREVELVDGVTAGSVGAER